MRHLPSSSALKAFEAAGRLGSFLSAAEEIHVTPGAVSRQIRSLEDFLGRKLFDRRHKQVILTGIGREYLAEIREPLNRIAKSSERLRTQDLASTISICAYPTFAIRWLIPRWGSLHDQYPNIDIQLTTTLNAADFDHGGYDLAIQIGSENKKIAGYAVEKLLEIDAFPVCSPELAENLRQPADLRDQTLLHGNPRPDDWKQWLDFAQVDGVDADAGLRFQSTNLAIHAAIEGLGVAIGLEVLIDDDLRSGRLVNPYTLKRRSHHPIQLVYPIDKASDPVFRSVRDWLHAEAGNDVSPLA